MTALSDALQAAQARTLQAMAKEYAAADLVDHDAIRQDLDAIGCRDHVEQDQWLSCLEVLRLLGAGAPPEARQNGTAAPEKASQRQVDYIARLADEARKTAPTRLLTKEEASDVIGQLQAGTYDPEAWS